MLQQNLAGTRSSELRVPAGCWCLVVSFKERLVTECTNGGVGWQEIASCGVSLLAGWL